MYLSCVVVLHSPYCVFVARVGPSGPRLDRPVREGARVASIETGLAAAAAKLSHQVGVHLRPSAIKDEEGGKEMHMVSSWRKRIDSVEPHLTLNAQCQVNFQGTVYRCTRQFTASASAFLCRQEEQKKKKKKTSKKKAPPLVEPEKVSQESCFSEPLLDSHGSSLTDHEYTTGRGKVQGGPQPMAPGVFLTQRLPSTSSQNRTSVKQERAVIPEAKGECSGLKIETLSLIYFNIQGFSGLEKAQKLIYQVLVSVMLNWALASPVIFYWKSRWDWIGGRMG